MLLCSCVEWSGSLSSIAVVDSFVQWLSLLLLCLSAPTAGAAVAYSLLVTALAAASFTQFVQKTVRSSTRLPGERVALDYIPLNSDSSSLQYFGLAPARLWAGGKSGLHFLCKKTSRRCGD